MKNLKKLLVGSGAVVLGVTLLGGCSASNNNTPSNNTSNEKKEGTEKKSETKNETKKDDNSGVETSGLKEKKVGDIKFKTSMLDKWDDSQTADLDGTMLVDEQTGNNITVSASEGAGSFGISSWDDQSAATIKETLEKSGFTEVTVGHTKVNNKEAFKVSYKIINSSIELYYIQLSGSKMAIVTYTAVTAADSFEKELKNVINTIDVA